MTQSLTVTFRRYRSLRQKEKLKSVLRRPDQKNECNMSKAGRLMVPSLSWQVLDRACKICWVGALAAVPGESASATNDLESFTHSTSRRNIPVVPHKAVAEVSKIGNL